MKTKLLYPFLVGASLLALGASGSSIVGVKVNESKIQNIHSTLIQMYETIKEQNRDIKILLRRK